MRTHIFKERLSRLRHAARLLQRAQPPSRGSTPILSPIRALAFDAYGTLVRATDPGEDPYATLFRQLQLDAVERREAADLALTVPLKFSELAHRLRPGFTLDWAPLEARLALVLGSVRPFAETLSVLDRLREQGLRLAIVSNLAPPYAEPLEHLFGTRVDVTVWSFAVGARKPEGEIFQAVSARLGIPAGEILMVGDSLRSDVEGARRAGMPALWLRRSSEEGDIRSLEGVLDFLAART